MKTLSFEKFKSGICVLLSALAGVLIAIPLAASVKSVSALIIVVLFGVMGALIGIRQRRSALFFCVSLVTVLVLAYLILKSITV